MNITLLVAKSSEIKSRFLVSNTFFESLSDSVSEIWSDMNSANIEANEVPDISNIRTSNIKRKLLGIKSNPIAKRDLQILLNADRTISIDGTGLLGTGLFSSLDLVAMI